MVKYIYYFNLPLKQKKEQIVGDTAAPMIMYVVYV